MAALLWIGCSTSSSGFRRSHDVTAMFENHRILPDYRYYYSGNDYKPTAVVGIHKDYNLSSPHWYSKDLDEKQLGAWMDRMMNQAGAEYNVFPNGAYILNAEGSRIGIWYSVWALPVLTFKSDKEFAISNPRTVFPPENRGDDRFEDSPRRKPW
jgi:hypothetical protein